LTWARWLEQLRLAQGLPPAKLVRVPLRLAQCACGVAQHLHPLAAPDNLRMLQRGVVGDGTAATRLLGRALRAPDARLQFPARTTCKGAA
jgi:hypothetical protein